MSGSAVERIRKDITKCFSEHGLRITIQSNLKTVNFLDLMFNLSSGKYYPYRKPNDKPLYINRLSNHPPSILKQLPAAISRRLTDISNDADVFREAAPLYNNALKDSGFTANVEYVNRRKEQGPTPIKNRSRKVTWFNPLYSKNVTTRIEQRFLRVIDKHFPKSSKLYRIFNQNTVKVSYSCMPNIGTVIKCHKAHVCETRNKNVKGFKSCNCRKPDQCPLNSECLTSGIIYKATVTTNDSSAPKIYIGSTETTFKQ